MMTLKEVAEQLGKSESTIYQNFKRTQQTLMKKGIILTKWGIDQYELEYEENDNEPYLERRRRERQEKKKKMREGK